MSKYEKWTEINEDEAMRLTKDREKNNSGVAVLIRLVDDGLIYSAKQTDLLTADELQQVVDGCYVAARYHARLAMAASREAKNRFGEGLDLDSDIIDLASDIAVEGVQ
jgi:hypothetical protein